MTPEKILSVVALYKQRLSAEKIPKQRMEINRAFSSCSKDELLAHAYYLIDGIEEYAQMATKVGKTGRHLGSLQTLLSLAGWYTLEELMNHNRPN